MLASCLDRNRFSETHPERDRFDMICEILQGIKKSRLISWMFLALGKHGPRAHELKEPDMNAF